MCTVYIRLINVPSNFSPSIKMYVLITSLHCFSFRIKFTSSVKNVIIIKVSLMNHSHDQLKYLKSNFAPVVIERLHLHIFFY